MLLGEARNKTAPALGLVGLLLIPRMSLAAIASSEARLKLLCDKLAVIHYTLLLKI